MLANIRNITRSQNNHIGSILNALVTPTHSMSIKFTNGVLVKAHEGSRDQTNKMADARGRRNMAAASRR